MKKDVQEQLLDEAYHIINRTKFPFYGFAIALTGVLYGLYMWFNPGYVVNTIHPNLDFITEQIIYIGLIVAGSIKILGAIINNGFIKRVGIISLSVVWGGIFIINTIWATGAGYPSPNFIVYGLILVLCLWVSYRGDFN